MAWSFRAGRDKVGRDLPRTAILTETDRVTVAATMIFANPPMSPPATPRAVVFDLDGLMFNTEELYQDVGAELLPDPIVGRGTPLPLLEHRGDASLFDIVEDCERRIILDMLEKCNWNQTEAADRFHVPLSTLNQKIKRLNIEIKKKIRE